MPELLDWTPEHQTKVSEYMDDNLHRLPESLDYDHSRIRSLSKYTHSTAHRKFKWEAVRTGGTREELLDAFKAEFEQTVGTPYELFTWTILAEAYWVRDMTTAHAEAVAAGVRVSDRDNRPDDILGEWICSDDPRDAMTRAGVK